MHQSLHLLITILPWFYLAGWQTNLPRPSTRTAWCTQTISHPHKMMGWGWIGTLLSASCPWESPWQVTKQPLCLPFHTLSFKLRFSVTKIQSSLLLSTYRLFNRQKWDSLLLLVDAPTSTQQIKTSAYRRCIDLNYWAFLRARCSAICIRRHRKDDCR